MKDFQDAYGHQIYDYLRGEYDGCGCEILERDDGYITASPSNEVWVYFSVYKDWSPHLKQEQARIIAESDDPHQTADPVHLEYHDYNRQRGRMPGQERFRVRYKKYVSPWFDWLMVSREEMGQILDGTGWRVKHFIDSKWSGYVAIIEKED